MKITLYTHQIILQITILCSLSLFLSTQAQYGYVLKDINPDAASSSPKELYVAGDLMYFSAYDNIHGRELWVTDGTQENTHMVKDIRAGSKNSDPINFTQVGNLLFFNAYDDTHGYELWATDGTSAKTYMVKDIHPGINTSIQKPGVEYNNKLYFMANDGIHGFELWESDGTTTGTNLVKDLNTGADGDGIPNNSYPQNFAVFAGKIYFMAKNNTDAQLWESDGTTAGTKVIKTLDTWVLDNPVIFKFTIHANQLYFNYGTKGIWSTDGTPTNTLKVTTSSASFTDFTQHQNSLYFTDGDYIIRIDNNKVLTKSSLTFGVSNPIAQGNYIYYEQKYFKDNGIVRNSLDLSKPERIADGRFVTGEKAVNNMLFFKSSSAIYTLGNETKVTEKYKMKVKQLVTGVNGDITFFKNKVFFSAQSNSKNLGVELQAMDIPLPHTISDIIPTQAKIGDTITIKGNNFDTKEKVKVLFYNDVSAHILSTTPTEIKLIVPSKAATGKIKVEVSVQETISTKEFVITPKITSISPYFGISGDQITIQGDGFRSYSEYVYPNSSNVPAIPDNNNVVYINGKKVDVLGSVEPNKITVSIGENTTGKLTIDVRGGQVTSTQDIIILQQPTITSFTPQRGKVGSEILISGTNFLPNDLSNNIVKINNVQAQVIEATNNQLRIRVPAGSSSGKIQLSIGNLNNSSTEIYTVLPSISCSPNTGTAGDLVIIEATNFAFDTKKEANIVRFNGVEAPISSATNNQLIVLVPSRATTGLVSVESNGQRITTDSNFIIDGITSLPSQHFNDSVKLFPNPSKDIVFIELRETPINEVFLQVYNKQGKLVLQQQATTATNVIQLNISSLTTGQYFLKLKLGVTEITRKIVKL